MVNKSSVSNYISSEEDLLEIAKALDIKCHELTDERDKLLKVIVKANKLAEIVNLVSQSTITSIAINIKKLVKATDRYYDVIKEVSNENTRSKNCNKLSN